MAAGQTDAAHDGTSDVGEDVSEQVRSNDDIQPVRARHEECGWSVGEHQATFNGRIVLGHLSEVTSSRNGMVKTIPFDFVAPMTSLRP